MAIYSKQGFFMICNMPFDFIEIFPDGSVYPCCPGFIYSYYFGNIFEEDFDEIWYGPRAVSFRSRFLAKDRTVCDLTTCFKEIIQGSYVKDEPCCNSTHPPYPKVIKFSHVATCNYACVTCRDEKVFDNENEVSWLNNKIETEFLPICKDAQEVIFSGDGEALFAKHYRELILKIADRYPDMKFSLHTNGSLCNKKQLEKLNILDRLGGISVSVHASTAETYQRITRQNNFQQVLCNLKEMSLLVSTGALQALKLFFVVHSENVTEMKSFAALAKSLGAKAYFWEFRDWGTDFGSNIEQVDVTRQDHPQHELLVAAVETLSPEALFSPVLKKLLHSR